LCRFPAKCIPSDRRGLFLHQISEPSDTAFSSFFQNQCFCHLRLQGGEGSQQQAFIAHAPLSAMLTKAAAPTILAHAPPSATLTNAAAPAILALAPDQSVTYILRGSAAAGGSVVLGFAVRARRLLRPSRR